MQASTARLNTPKKLALSVCLAIGLLMPTGCKSGESWAPKMPKFGMPELAFGSKKKNEEIKPPAMNFSPDGERAGSIAELPSRGTPSSELVAAAERNSNATRAPYAVEDYAAEDKSESLADIAKRNSQQLAQDSQNLAEQRANQYMTQGQDALLSAQNRMSNSIADSRLLPSDRNSTGSPVITGIPGGPLGNTLGGGTFSNGGLSSSQLAQDTRTSDGRPSGATGLPPAPQSDTRLAANPFPPANTGLLPPASPLATPPQSPMTGVAAIPSREPENSFAGTASVNTPDSTLPKADMISPTNPPGLTQPNSSGYTSPSSGLNPPAGNSPLNRFPTAPIQPNPASGFRPGSTGHSVSMVPAGTTTRQPLTAGYSSGAFTGGHSPETSTSPNPPSVKSPGVNLPGVISNPHHVPAPASQPTTLPQYPSTNFGTFQSPNNFQTQPINNTTPVNTTPANSGSLPAFPGTPNTSYRPNAAPGSYSQAVATNGSHAGAPEGMVCDGDQCYLPRQ